MYLKKGQFIISVVIFLSMTVILLAGCNPTPQTSATVSPPTVAVEAPVVEPTTEPAPVEDTRGMIIYKGSKASILTNFNPLLYDVRVWLYDGLIRFDENEKPIGDLAESWEVSEDGKVYTIKLHQGVLFHDGVEMTADDVVYTAQLTLDEKNNSLYRSKFIIGGKPVKWEKIDTYTVRATLPYASSSFLAKLSRADEIFFCILPKHILEKCTDLTTCDFNQHPIGTGPFKLAEFVPDQKVVLEANDNYFQGKPGVKYVIRLAYPNEQSALAAIMAGELDVSSLQEAGNVKVAEGNPDLTIYRYDSNWVMAGRVNMLNPILKDLKVRQAISYAVDRLSLVKAVIGPTTNIGNSPINLGWSASPNVVVYNYDPEKAKSLLEEAGWVEGSDGIREKDGQRLSLSMTFDSSYGKPDLAVGIQQYFKVVGIELTLKQLEPATAEETIYVKQDFDIYLDWQGFGVDPDIASRWIMSTQGKEDYLSNPSSYSNPLVDEAFAAAGIATTTEERQKYLWKAQDLITADAPAIWLHLWQAQSAVSKNVGGLSLPASAADMDNTGIFREPWKLTSTRPAALK